MKENALNEFFLVGGTNIALKLGHRKSIDLDLFTKNDFDVYKIENILIEKYDFKRDFLKGNALKGEIQGLKIYCIKDSYPILNQIEISDEIRMLSLEDICAMKLSVIEHNGTRIKDFTDIAFLSEIFSFNEMASFYKQKFNTQNTLMLAKSLLYFNDLDFDNEPVQLIKGKFNWGKIQTRLFDMIENPEKIFEKQRKLLIDLPKQKKNIIEVDKLF